MINYRTFLEDLLDVDKFAESVEDDFYAIEMRHPDQDAGL